MARKTFTPKKPTHGLEPQTYAAFIGDVLDGTITAVKLIDTHPGNKLDMKYDDT